jgi:hypothetical protein
MKFRPPLIETRVTGEWLLVRVRYESPEKARLLLSLHGMAVSVLLISLGALAVWLIATTPGRSTGGERMVMMFAALPVSLALAWGIASWLTWQRFFVGRNGDRRLNVNIDRSGISVAGRTYPRGPVLRFMALPHKRGKLEPRYVEATSQLATYTYRDAFQLWLQHGEQFIELASISNEDAANAIARRLQAADETVTRGAGPYAEASPFGERQALG